MVHRRQEGALTAMASVADCAKEHFERYYDSVMPLLRHLLSSASQRTHQLLRAKALECISLVGMAVGRDRFRADAHEVMKFMQALQVRPVFRLTLHFDRLPGQFCRLLERLAGHYIEHWVRLRLRA